MSADLNALAATVEQASGPDRELDREIGFAIRNGRWISPGAVPAYTGSLDDAASLRPADHTWAAGECGEENMPWACVTQPLDPCRDFSADAATVPLALVAACLRARAQQEGS